MLGGDRPRRAGPAGRPPTPGRRTAPRTAGPATRPASPAPRARRPTATSTSAVEASSPPRYADRSPGRTRRRAARTCRRPACRRSKCAMLIAATPAADGSRRRGSPGPHGPPPRSASTVGPSAARCREPALADEQAAVAGASNTRLVSAGSGSLPPGRTNSTPSISPFPRTSATQSSRPRRPAGRRRGSRRRGPRSPGGRARSGSPAPRCRPPWRSGCRRRWRS